MPMFIEWRRTRLVTCPSAGRTVAPLPRPQLDERLAARRCRSAHDSQFETLRVEARSHPSAPHPTAQSPYTPPASAKGGLDQSRIRTRESSTIHSWPLGSDASSNAVACSSTRRSSRRRSASVISAHAGESKAGSNSDCPSPRSHATRRRPTARTRGGSGARRSEQDRVYTQHHPTARCVRLRGSGGGTGWPMKPRKSGWRASASWRSA